MRKAYAISLLLNAALILSFFGFGAFAHPDHRVALLARGVLMAAVSLLFSFGVKNKHTLSEWLGLLWLGIQSFRISSATFHFSLGTGISVPLIRSNSGVNVQLDVVVFVFLLVGCFYVYRNTPWVEPVRVGNSAS